LFTHKSVPVIFEPPCTSIVQYVITVAVTFHDYYCIINSSL